jgi:hypothetical protein
MNLDNLSFTNWEFHGQQALGCTGEIASYTPRVLQIVFNDISAAELSHLPVQVQFQLLEALNIKPDGIDDVTLAARFGVLERQGKKLYRCRAGEHRIYFAVTDGMVRIHRVVHKNTFQDFLVRSNLKGTEDEALSQSKHFWQLIDEGAKTLRVAGA